MGEEPNPFFFGEDFNLVTKNDEWLLGWPKTQKQREDWTVEKETDRGREKERPRE